MPPRRRDDRCQLCGEHHATLIDYRYSAMFVHPVCVALAERRGSDYVRAQARRPLCDICWKPGAEQIEGTFVHYRCYMQYA